MSNLDSLSAGSSQPNSDPIGSGHESDGNSDRSLSMGHVDVNRLSERRRKGKQIVYSSSSSESVTIIRDTAVEVSSQPATDNEDRLTVTSNWVARPPLLMENIPRLAVDKSVSEVRVGELEVLRVAYSIPQDVEIRVPGLEWRASRPPVGWRCIFEDQLKCGFQLPVPSFVCDVLRYFGVPISQVLPNAVRILIQFALSCGKQNVKPTVSLFRYFFQMKRAPQATGSVIFTSREGFRIVTPENNAG